MQKISNYSTVRQLSSKIEFEKTTMTVMADGMCEEPIRPQMSPSATRRSPSPLDLRRGENTPRLPFSISSLLSSSLSSQLTASSRQLLDRVEAEKERDLIERERVLLNRERELLGREREKLFNGSRESMERQNHGEGDKITNGRDISVRDDKDLLTEQSDDRHSDSDGEALHDDEPMEDHDEGREDSNPEDDDQIGKSFNPYTYSHMPFAAGLLPQLQGLLPSLGGYNSPAGLGEAFKYFILG